MFEFTRFPFRLILVDNASDKQTAQYLDKIKEENPEQVVLIRNSENLGWVKAVNQGILYSNSLYVCAMNNDTVAYLRWLSEMVDVAEEGELVGLVNPLWELPKRYKRTPDKYFRKIITQQSGKFIETDYARGFCFLIKRKVISKIGGLDEVFSPGYYDDWGYSLRAMEAGFKCVRAKGAFVRHYRSITYLAVWGETRFNSLFQEREKIFYKKWGRSLRILLIIDSSLSKNLPLLKDFGLSLLEGQNRPTIINTQRELNIEHTNCTMKYSLSPMAQIRSTLNIMDNFRHSSSKRYDCILCSPKIDKFLNRFSFIKNNYLIKKLDTNLMNVKDLIKDLGNLKKYA